ncbi:Nucleosome-remodeling factor subunit BPTF [Auxenochlorella protothecoides]|uniref:Nucleosome-remodeling factor subunit BPTF n=1 Tax=Auxenochlorella protothecoides TaxID=3075 RepID=A0A087SSV5_AUXPR|nr:Nucleosome-remodeling factor subunit BPTF [Auxenochlorella protothecoides]KFM28809.1 Nucleosome-remodeling factor subunit BPTF [Auxenochlorella protothecoides]
MVWWKAAVTPAYQQVVAREAEGNQIGYPLASDVASLRLTDSNGFRLEPFVRKVDDRLFPPPAEAALPASFGVALADSDECLDIPTDLLGSLAASYQTLRAFSWQLRLAPFPLAAYCAALAAEAASHLVDEVHVSMLRALMIDETAAERAQRALDPQFLDALTWPLYLWDWLRLSGSPLARGEVKVKILESLANSLLDCITIRAEIDRREAAGQLVAGCEAGPAVAPPPQVAGALDHNTDTCVLCGLGGNLICCDGCPATYHMRCLGETSKSLGDGEWLCPECVAGGRGEAAGVRLPPGARNAWKQPYYLAQGSVIRAAMPTLRGRGSATAELPEPEPPVYVYRGAAAREALKQAHRIRSADEIPEPSSFEAVEAGKDAEPADVASYNNTYRNGWAAAAGAIRAAMEDARRRKGRGQLWVPTGTCGHVAIQEPIAPLTVSKHQWVFLQGRATNRQTVRCGKCYTCLRPSLRKGCLNPLVKGDEAGEGPETTKLEVLLAGLLKMEREFWALAGGPWPGEEGAVHRIAWGSAVRVAANVQEVRPTRRCGRCPNCLNPAAKKGCTVLASLRTAKRTNTAGKRVSTGFAPAGDGSAALVQALVASAIAKALVAAGGMDEGAAMAAKLRRHAMLAAGAGRLAEAASHAAQREAQPEPEPLADHQRRAAGRPLWLPEAEVPLWAVKTFEDRARRALQGPGTGPRGGGGGGAPAGPRRQRRGESGDEGGAGPRAATPGGAEPGSACARCGGPWEGEAADEPWIACDACDDWFHGDCVSLSAEDIASLPEAAAWNCPRCCAGARDSSRRRAAGQGVSAAAAPTPHGGTGSLKRREAPASPGGEVVKRPRGRPPKARGDAAGGATPGASAPVPMQGAAPDLAPVITGAQAVAQAAPVITSRKASGSALREPDPAVVSTVEQAQGRRRGQVAAPPATEAAGPEISCPVCRLPDYGRPLLGCDACQMWFHYECAGVSAKEVDSKAPFLCKPCRGLRPMDIQTIQRKLAKGAYTSLTQLEADVALIWSNCRAYNLPTAPVVGEAAAAEAALDALWQEADLPKTLNPAAATEAGSTDAPAPAKPGPALNWRKPALKVLKKLQALSISYPFWAPVRAEDAPDYGAVVKQPMDLGTISDRLKGEDYATPAQVRADVELVWRNAGAYNGRGHPITVAAAACSTAFKKAWRDVGLG